MSDGLSQIAERLRALKNDVAALVRDDESAPAATRWRDDLAAALFHLSEKNTRPVVALLGGTGTGKSTLLNRLLDTDISATSFRRTYTGGSIAVTAPDATLPAGWLDYPHTPVEPDALPVAGEPGALQVAAAESPITAAVSLVDTPDVDGETEGHHVTADRTFRWAEAVVFLVTPEKYQMTELLPYYRLAARYGLTAVFVMNKCESAAVIDDYRAQLTDRGWAQASVFALPRDDATFAPDQAIALPALREAVAALTDRPAARGQHRRAADLLTRLRDQIIGPWRRARAALDAMDRALTTLGTPEPGVDVSPVTHELREKMQSQSVLYLMGPQRMMDRVRQVPTMLARMPRAVWNFMVKGKDTSLADTPEPREADREPPDFHAILTDQFAVFQDRLEQTVLTHAEEAAIALDGSALRGVMVDPADAGRIADEELAALKKWLSEKWEAKPRDTRLLTKMLRALPGGDKLVEYTEAAPWLLAVILAIQGMALSGIDWIIIGGFSLATWLSEKLSNEVTARTRQTNQQIQQRFEKLAEQQIADVRDWLQTQAPALDQLASVEKQMDSLAEVIDS